MHHRSSRGLATPGLLTTVLAAGAAAVLALQPAPKDAAPARAAGAWTVDAVHSSVAFKIRHNGASNFNGVIYGPKGTFAIEPDAAKCALDITVPVAGILTGNAKRDQHLKSPDFFKAEEFPNITFKATAFKSAGEGRYDMTGDLTLTGVTKSVTVPLVVTGKGKGMGGEVMGVESTFTIKRTDFHMDKFVKEGALGDEVAITVSLEGGSK